MDDAAPLMHVQWIRALQRLQDRVDEGVILFAEEIVGGQALTRVNDTNVTATLTGTPATALLKAVTITLGWSGTLGLARGGTAADLSATGGTAQYLKQVSIGAAITVGTIPASDIASPGALTRTNDTNVTLTLGGSPTVALLAATSLTLGWTGTLAVTRGGIGVGTLTAHGVLIGNGTGAVAVTSVGATGQVLTGVTGADPVFSAPAAAATSVIVDDTTTNATMFPVWVTASSGSLPLKVSSTKLSFNPSIARLHLTNTVSPELRIDLGAGTTSFSSVSFYEGALLGGAFQYIGSAFATAARRSDLSIAGTRIVLAAARTLVDADASIIYSRQLTIGQSSRTLSGIEIIAQSVSWFIDHAGTSSATNNRLTFGNASLGNILNLLTTGQVGLGTGSPTAWLHLKAGTTAASTAPLKFVSGPLQTTAEAGAVEFLTDAFYGTITTGAARKTFAFLEAPVLTTWSSSGKLTNYNGINTAGWGIPVIQASGRSIAQVAAVASVTTYTVGAADGSFRVAGNVNVTTSTTYNFTVAVDYTDETNTAQTLTLTFSQLAGVFVTAITNVTGAGPYEGIPLQIRCKASTAITMKTVGVFTAVTYNVEGTIQQVS